MAEIEQNIRIKAGNKVPIRFTITGIENFAGFTLKWGLSEASHTDKLVEIDNTGDQIEVNVPVVLVKVNPDDTRNIPRGRYYHELYVVDAAGKSKTLAAGQVILRDSIFR